MNERENLVSEFNKYNSNGSRWKISKMNKNTSISTDSFDKRVCRIKMVNVIENIGHISVFNMLMDPQLRSKWDKSTSLCSPIYKIDNFSDVVVKILKLPDPYHQRSVILYRCWEITEEGFIICYRSINHKRHPETDTCTRAIIEPSGTMCQIVSERKVILTSIVQINLRGSVPKKLYRHIALEYFGKFLSRLQKQIEKTLYEGKFEIGHEIYNHPNSARIIEADMNDIIFPSSIMNEYMSEIARPRKTPSTSRKMILTKYERRVSSRYKQPPNSGV